MENFYDDLAKSIAAGVSRRESLRYIGAGMAGAMFGHFGLGTASAAGPDPCKTFCLKCSTKAKQNQCITACRSCKGNTSRLGGSCGNFVCCPTAACNGVCSDLKSDPNCGACGNDCRAYGEKCCGNYCANLANDFDNCGGCGSRCEAPGPYEYGACIAGVCVYECVEGAADCGDGTCTYLGFDSDNCGACGNVCSATTPFCTYGTCTATYCDGADLMWDSQNCGECGNVCPDQFACAWGVCEGVSYGY